MIKPCGYRRMRSKEVPCPGDGHRRFKILAGPPHIAGSTLQHGEGRMSFIQMADFWMEPESA